MVQGTYVKQIRTYVPSGASATNPEFEVSLVSKSDKQFLIAADKTNFAFIGRDSVGGSNVITKQLKWDTLNTYSPSASIYRFNPHVYQANKGAEIYFDSGYGIGFVIVFNGDTKQITMHTYSNGNVTRLCYFNATGT